MKELICSICESSSGREDLCPSCAGLLRWVRAYFRFIPDGTAERIGPATRFLDDLAVESLDWMDWLLEAEEKLDIAIADHQAERIQTVGEFVRMLKEAGAWWPDDRDVRLAPRRGWCSPYRWDTVLIGAEDPPQA